MDFPSTSLTIRFATIALLSAAISACSSNDSDSPFASEPTVEVPVEESSGQASPLVGTSQVYAERKFTLADDVELNVTSTYAAAYVTSAESPSPIMTCGYGLSVRESDGSAETSDLLRCGADSAISIDGSKLFVTTDEFCPDARADINIYVVNEKTQFDQGSLGITSTQYDDLDSDSGVCATMLTGTVAGAEDEPQDRLYPGMNVITVAAPYGDDIIELRLVFLSNPAPGRYQVVAPEDVGMDAIDVSESSAIARVYSSEFGGTAEMPVGIEATDGWIEITAKEMFAVAGVFELSMRSGDTLTGSFDVVIE